MKINMGAADRSMRFFTGVVIIALGFIFRSWWGLLGIIPLVTATTRFCPLYLPFGISTARAKKE